MRIRISRQAIAKLPETPASASKYILWDREIPGFGAYKSSNGRTSFIYQYRMPKKKEIRSKLLGYFGEITLEDARAFASKLAFQRRQGIDPVLEERKAVAAQQAATDLVLSTYAEGFLQRRIDEKKPLNKGQTAIVRRDVVGLLGDKRIDELTIDDVEGFSRALGKRATSAIRMGLTYLKIILNDAKRRGRIASAPTDQLKIPKSGSRKRRLRDWEIKRFHEAISDVADARTDVLEVLLRTAKRKDEVRELTWEELDLPKGTWTLNALRSKNRNGYVIYLPRQVIAIIARQQPDAKLRRGPVFTLNGGRTAPEIASQVKDLVDANMHRRVEDANARDDAADTVEHFTFHDLRTTVASRLQEKPFLIQKDILDAILLHTGGGGIVNVYATAQLEIEAGEALQKWNDWLDALFAQSDMFPGGRLLPKLRDSEVQRRIIAFREGWPERADQTRARKLREADTGEGRAPRGRKARAEARRKQNEAKEAGDDSA